MLHQLPKLTDIDTISDIKTVLNSGLKLSSALLFIFIRLVRKQPTENEYYRQNNYRGTFLSNLHNKGAPSLS